MFRLFLQRKEFDGFKLNGRGFGLDGDVSLGQRSSVVELDLVVFANDLAFGDVLEFVAPHFDFDRDPLITVEGGAAGVDDMAFGELSFPMKVGAGGADVEGPAIPFAESSEELDLEK